MDVVWWYYFWQAEEITKAYGGVDILVNNAAVVVGESLLDCTPEQIQRTIEVNLLGQFWVILTKYGLLKFFANFEASAGSEWWQSFHSGIFHGWKTYMVLIRSSPR